MLQISDSLTYTDSTQQHVLCVTSDVLSCCWLLVCWWETKRNLCNTLNNRQKCSRVHETPPSAEKHGGEHTPHSQALITLLTLECEFRGFPCRSHLEMQFNLISWKKKKPSLMFAVFRVPESTSEVPPGCSLDPPSPQTERSFKPV